MAYDEHDDRVICNHLIANTVGSLRDKMYIFLDQYRKTGEDEYIREIMTLPERRRSILNNIIAETSQAALVNFINKHATVSATDFDNELVRLETQATNLKSQLDSGTTIAEIADTIEANLVKGPIEKIRELIQYEPNFIDMFGRNRRPI